MYILTVNTINIHFSWYYIVLTLLLSYIVINNVISEYVNYLRFLNSAIVEIIAYWLSMLIYYIYIHYVIIFINGNKRRYETVSSYLLYIQDNKDGSDDPIDETDYTIGENDTFEDVFSEYEDVEVEEEEEEEVYEDVDDHAVSKSSSGFDKKALFAKPEYNWKELAKIEDYFWDDICSEGIDYYWFEDQDKLNMYRRRLYNNDFGDNTHSTVTSNDSHVVLNNVKQPRRRRAKKRKRGLRNKYRFKYKYYKIVKHTRYKNKRFYKLLYGKRGKKRVVINRWRIKKRLRRTNSLSGLDYEAAFKAFKLIINIEWMEKVLLHPPTSMDYVRPNKEKLILCNDVYVQTHDVAILYHNTYMYKYSYPHSSIFNIKTIESFRKFICKYEYRDNNMYHRVYNYQIVNYVKIWYSRDTSTKCLNNIYYDHIYLSRDFYYMQIVYKYNSCYEQYDKLLEMILFSKISDTTILYKIDEIDNNLLLICLCVSVMLCIIYLTYERSIIVNNKYKISVKYLVMLITKLEFSISCTSKQIKYLETIISGK